MKALSSKNIFLLLFISLTFVFSCTRTIDQKSVVVNLEGEDWGVLFDPSSEILNNEFNFNSLELTSVPGNLRNLNRSYRGPIWLRKSFEVTKEQHDTSLAVQLGRTYQNDEVFINGVLVGKNNSPFGQNPKEYSFGRPRIYPIPHNLILEGENVLVIKIDSDLSTSAGVISGPVRILTYQEAIEGLNYQSLVELIFVGFYLFIALFFFINFFKMRDKKEYKSFAILALIFSAFELSRNEARFFIGDYFTAFKLIEYGFLLVLPYAFIKFIQDFFEIKIFRLQLIYLGLQFLFILVFAIIPRPVFWYNFIGYWDIHLFLIVSYAIYLTIKKLKEEKRGAWIHLIALAYLFYAIVKEVAIERGYLNALSSLETSFLFYLLSMTLALRFQFLIMKRKLLSRFDRLKEADSLREKIFFYMDAMISQPLTIMKEKLQQFREVSEKSKEKAIIKELKNVHSSIDTIMDDIIELSRLEVMKEVPFKDQVNFVSFIHDVIPDEKITYSIKVHPETEIYNSLDLVNSIVIRLVDFPPFGEFSHNDLIITQDLKGNVHFRFLLFHSNPKVTYRLYNDLIANYETLTPNKVKWAIILEIVRLLDAKIDFKIIKKKYLKIDLGISAIAPLMQNKEINLNPSIPTSRLEPVKGKSNKEDWRVTIKRIYDKMKTIEIKFPKKKK
ncbi:hypothetical protein LPTSP4_32820 [Leptospira ryugenii]|uniref:7TM-DISM receptor extracellular domain-containing protein n=1 Tax=Leptospira ryugenii TaxID=1917863 RepID=A0A2P2E4G7_9LEPT|nr:7TM-DISM domain-containing protein [Leptospira ryugenii]GBF51744.1 hypothetical protein LPTSP4_32820 [Leptospira ryugenii]